MHSRRALLACAGLALGGIGAAALTRHAPEKEAAQPLPPAPRPLPEGGRVWLTPAEAMTVSLPHGREVSVRSLLNIRRAMRYGDYVWNEQAVPAGQMWIRIDTERQLISVFRGAHEVGSAVILYGTPGKPTPVGAFPVLQKAKAYHSQTYDAPMPFMLRLTDDGVAIHASTVRKGWATHGCIGVPLEFAKQVFAQVQLGDPVLIDDPNAATNGKAPARRA